MKEKGSFSRVEVDVKCQYPKFLEPGRPILVRTEPEPAILVRTEPEPANFGQNRTGLKPKPGTGPKYIVDLNHMVTQSLAY